MVTLIFGSCAKDFLSNDISFSRDEDVVDAREQFEATATDLCEVNFGMTVGQPKTKANSKTVITPLWNKTKIVSSGKFTSFEVPLGGDVRKYASIRHRSDSVRRKVDMKKITTKLILKKNNETGKYIYFIATMVGKNEDKNVKEIEYIHNRSFTGHIFISNLDGLCVGIYNCHSGVRRRSSFVNVEKESTENADQLMIQMFTTQNGAYSVGENCPDKCWWCIEADVTCYNCNICTSVIIDICGECKNLETQCSCCSICHKKPCECYVGYGCYYCGSYYCSGECQYRCSNCGSQFCNGQCQNCPYCGSRSCSGSCQSGGGGGGTNPPTDPDPEEPCPHGKCYICDKYIRTMTRSIACNNEHVFCPTNGDCEPVVTLSVSSTNPTLGDNYTLSVSISPAKVTCNEIAYTITDLENIPYSISVNSSNQTFVTTKARMPGKFTLSAKIVMNETYKEITSNLIAITHQCPSINTLKEISIFKSAIDPLWIKTLNAADTEGVREYGGVLFLNMPSDDRSPYYEFPETEGAKTPYSVKEVQIELNVTPYHHRDPSLGGRFAVMIFHTHPPLNKYKGTPALERKPGPSQPDIDNHVNIPATVYDFDMAIHRSTDKKLPNPKLSLYGADRAIIDLTTNN